MDEEERNFELLQRQLDRVADARVGEDGICWTIFSVFAAAQAVLVTAFVTRSNAFQSNFTSSILCLVGIGSSLAWALVLKRALGYIKLHERLIARLEEAAGVDCRFCMSSERNKELCDDVLNGPRARNVMMVCTWLTVAGWLVTLGYYFCRMWRIA